MMDVICLAYDSGLESKGNYYYHKDSGQIYGPGRISGAYAAFREKFRESPGMTPDSFIIAPKLENLPHGPHAGESERVGETIV